MAPTPLDALCLGEALVQVSPVDGVRLREARAAHLSLGGAEANVAIGLALQGIRVAWAGALGADPLGHGLIDQLAARGVDVSLVERREDAPTGLYLKDPSPAGSRPYYYRRGSAASLMDRDTARRWAAATRPRLVHVGGITPLLSETADGFIDEIVVGRAFGDAIVSFDVNHRPALSTASTPDRLAELARAADLVLVGRDEAERLWGTVTADDIRAYLGGRGLLVVKDGDREAVAFERTDRVAVPAGRVEVVEPTGAGDAFAAGFLGARLRGSDLADSLGAGHRLAARALTTRHDVPDAEPTKAAATTAAAAVQREPQETP